MDKILLCRMADGEDRKNAENRINKELSSGEWEIKQIYHMGSDSKDQYGSVASTLVVVLRKVHPGGSLCFDPD